MDQLDVEIKLPRLNVNQKNRPNPSNINNCEDYYKITIFIPLLDSIIEDLKRRFYGQENQTIQTLTYFIPKNLTKWSQNINSTISTNIMVQKIKTSYTFLQVSDVLLMSEIDLWIQKWHSYDLKGQSVPENVFHALEECCETIYPTIKSLLIILAALPISTASAERSFSTLRRLKTWMRSRMGEERLTGLALLNTHRDISIDIEKIIDRFAAGKKRTIKLLL
ncbi:unnamed protein product [Macrosiphum euphorbiae]|uniref:HAT C-terminal dimerisation domain-containing protein n=1 Tax=Macrosiphum euphorbiae TaxID=13131 RepID=A0AAV0VPE3_9HEMI|nr:unnamed protein product [Macrosiphum euphorbiae]